MTDDPTSLPPSPGVSVPPPAAATRQPARLRGLSPQTMWLTAAVIAVLTAAAVVVLWWPATRGLNGAELVSARLDALKIGLSVAVGSGGVVALFLAWRRQRSTEGDLDNRERALAHQQHDAAERRLTELYLKAVEQLGSAHAAVRHGGLYALERVAQDNPSQRQTVVNVICAYLRNPYTPPPATSGSRPLGVRRPLLRNATATRSAPTPSRDGGREALLQEREVRLTAQRILRWHLQPGPEPHQPEPTFWQDIDLDLSGAILINFALCDCVVATAIFDGTSFTGDAGFGGATFTGHAVFNGATFTGEAEFGGATFTGDAGFHGATFTGRAEFDRATFTGDARFDRATFVGRAWFGRATFTGDAGFVQVTFTGDAGFDAATFAGIAGFAKVTFTGDAGFVQATFTRSAWFDRATFTRSAGFHEATFNGVAGFDGATFTDFAGFHGATFNGLTKFDKTPRKGLPFDPTTRAAPPPDEAPAGPEGDAP